MSTLFFFMDFNSLVNFSNFFIPLCPSFPPFYLINRLFYWSANSNIWIIHESSSIMVPPPNLLLAVFPCLLTCLVIFHCILNNGKTLKSFPVLSFHQRRFYTSLVRQNKGLVTSIQSGVELGQGWVTAFVTLSSPVVCPCFLVMVLPGFGLSTSWISMSSPLKDCGDSILPFRFF